MGLKLPIFFLCCVCGTGAAFAKEVALVLTEITVKKIPDAQPPTRFKENRKDTAFAIDVVGLKAAHLEEPHGAPVNAIAKYIVTDHHLSLGNRAPLAADEILAQCNIDGTDLVVTRRSYTSVNPLYWFGALSGHPAQFSEIVVILIRDNNVQTINLTAELKQSNVSRWKGAVFVRDMDQKLSP